MHDDLEQRRQMLRERFLSNRAFERFFEVLSTYKRLLSEAEDDEARQLIKQRFHDFFDKSEEEMMGDMLDEQGIRRVKSAISSQREISSLVETNQLTKDKLVELFVNFEFADKYLEHLERKPGSRSETGNLQINELIEIVPGEKSIEINITANDVKGTQNIIAKMIEGLRMLAAMMQENESFSQVTEIKMTSWLFGDEWLDKVKMVLGNDVELVDETNPEKIRGVQNMALSFNKRAVERYLLGGKEALPKVRTLVFNREQFIGKFGAV